MSEDGLALFIMVSLALRTLKLLGLNRWLRPHPSSVPPTGAFNTPLPPVVHARLDTLEPTDRVLIVGDVHGCLEELELLLKAANWRQGFDTLVLVGDLVNKGPDSSGVVKFARKVGALSVRGNHDDACIRRIVDMQERGDEPPPYYSYIKDLTGDDVDWLMNMPYTLTIPSHRAIVVHAGLVPGVPLTDQAIVDMYMMRNLLPAAAPADDSNINNGDTVSSSKSNSSSSSAGPPWRATSADTTGVPWAPLWADPDYKVYFGHDAKRGVQLCPRATGLDSGSCYGKQLTAVSLPDERLHHVQALKVYQVPKGNE